MKRMLIAVLGAAMLIGLTVAPVAAAKGGPSTATLKGSYSGTATSQWLSCAWDPENIYQGAKSQGWTFQDVGGTNTAGVSAGLLGKGTMVWTDFFFSGPGPWSYTASDKTSHLWGTANLTGPPFVATVIVQGGNGKFFGVSGGQISLYPTGIGGGAICPGLNPSNPPFPPFFWNIQYSWPQSVNTAVTSGGVSGSLVGYLRYG